VVVTSNSAAVEGFKEGRVAGGKAAEDRLPAGVAVPQGKGCTRPVVVGRGCILAGERTDCTPGAWEGLRTPVGGRACWAALGKA